MSGFRIGSQGMYQSITGDGWSLFELVILKFAHIF